MWRTRHNQIDHLCFCWCICDVSGWNAHPLKKRQTGWRWLKNQLCYQGCSCWGAIPSLCYPLPTLVLIIWCSWESCSHQIKWREQIIKLPIPQVNSIGLCLRNSCFLWWGTTHLTVQLICKWWFVTESSAGQDISIACLIFLPLCWGPNLSPTTNFNQGRSTVQ